MITQGNVNDREPLKQKSFHERIFGKLIGDKGYISQTLFEQLFIDGIHLITKIRKNMKNCLMHIHDKILLRKRALIETVNDELKISVRSNTPDIAVLRILSPTSFQGLLPILFFQRSLV